MELAVFESFREVQIEVLSFRFGVAVLVLAHLLAVLLINGFFFGHSVIYSAPNKHTIKKKEIKVLPLSSNREKLR